MISVIIPLYNKEAIIERSLRSVLSQDYDDYEVVIVDDGSMDNSAAVAKQFIDNLPPSTGGPGWVFITQENGGPSKARNTGVKHAKGEWIVFLDADDELLPGALITFKNKIDRYVSCDFITCSYKSLSKDGHVHLHVMKEKIVQNPFKESYFYQFHTRTGVAIYRKQLLVETPFDEGLRRYEDFDLWYRLFRKARIATCSDYVLQENAMYGEACKPRRNIMEDYVGHLSFNGICFWERMCLYKLYLGERDNYPVQIKQIYPSLHLRYDLLLLHKILMWLYV